MSFTAFDPDDVPDRGLLRVEGPDDAAAVARIDGVLHAIRDSCTHDACALSDGDVEGAAVYCPCHGSKFDLRDGAVLSGPAFEPLTVLRIGQSDGAWQIEWEDRL